MIKSKKGKTRVNGSMVEMMADFVVITITVINALVDERGFSKEEAVEIVKDNFELAIMYEDERHKKMAERIVAEKLSRFNNKESEAEDE
jgi:hypothetical protein